MRGRKVRSYQHAASATNTRRVRDPASSGMPRKISTLRAIAPIETSSAAVSAPNHPGTTARKKYPSSE